MSCLSSKLLPRLVSMLEYSCDYYHSPCHSSSVRYVGEKSENGFLEHMLCSMPGHDETYGIVLG